ncbi:MAG: D-alanyl-D-alanine carboxypeptidase/D-alanyl-D-alanine-endopeptidase [Planctomycetota bacterium]
MHRTVLPAVAISLLLCTPATGQPLAAGGLREALTKLVDNHPTARRTTVCLKVVDLETGEVLYDRGGDRLLVPASNLKIYTTACALDRFGPDRRFETKLQIRGEMVASALTGEIVLVGGGDAMLSTAALGKLADWVAKEAGVRKLVGRVRADQSRYASPLKGPGWMWDDEPDYYNMSVTPLMLDFNVLRVRLESSAGGKPTARLVPPASYPPLSWSHQAGSANSWIDREPFTDAFLLSNPSSLESSLEERVTMDDPSPWIESVFKHQLQPRVIEIEHADHSRVLPFVSEHSRPGASLAETVKHFNRVSENAVGEVLLHELAIDAGREQPAWSAGASVISDWLVGVAGLERGSFRLVDGSGLSRYNLISADSSIRLLQYMHKHPTSSVFYEALPKYGVEVAAPSDSENKEERIAAKPGGMSSVSTISGYADTLGGRRLAFSLLTNGYIGSNRPVIDLRGKVWQTLVRYRPSDQ